MTDPQIVRSDPIGLATVRAGMEIRPQPFGENLSVWFRALAETWRPLLTLCAILYVPIGVVTAVLLLLSGFDEAYFDLLLSEDQIQDPAELLELVEPLIWVGLIWAVLQLLATVLVTIAAARALASHLNGKSPTAGDLLRFAMSRLGSGVAAGVTLLVGFTVVVAIASLAGWALMTGMGVDFFPIFLTMVVALTALVVVTWLTVSFALYLVALAMDDVGAGGALTSSFRLVRGRWWPTLGFLLLTGLTVSVASQVISVVMIPVFFLALLAPGFLAAGYGLVTMLQGPVAAATAIAYAVWYIDLRARHEPGLVSEGLL
jgi:hypothetical protein